VFLDKVTRCIEDGDNVDVVHFDFAKAFDKVPHQQLTSVVTIASEPASIDYDRSFEKKSRCRCRFDHFSDVTRACGLTIS